MVREEYLMKENIYKKTIQDSSLRDEVNIHFIAEVLLRRSKTIFIILIVGMICSMSLVSFILTPQHKISAMIRPGTMGFDDKGQPISYLKPGDFKAWINSKAYETVLIEKFGKDLPNIKASLNRQGSIIILRLYHKNPDIGRAIMQEILAHMLDGTSGLKFPSRLCAERIATEKAIAEKQRELKIISAEKEKIDTEIDKLYREIKIIPEEKKDLDNDIARLQKDLEFIDVERSKISRKISFLQAEIFNNKQRINIQKKAIETLEKKQISLKDKISKINRNTEELINMRNKSIKARNYDKMTFLMLSDIIQENLDLMSNLEQEILDISKEINKRTEKINDCKLQIEQLQKEVDLLKIQQNQELEKKKFNIDIEIHKIKRRKKTILEKKYKDLLAQIHELETKQKVYLKKKRQDIQDEIAKLQAQLNALALAEVVQPPYSSPEPVRPKKALILALTFCTCLVLGIILAFLKEFLINEKTKCFRE